MKAVSYGAFDMQANGVSVIETDVDSAPPNRIQADALAERDGALIVKQQYESKPFMVRGKLRKDTQADLDDLIDTFKAAMAVKNQPFDIEHGSSTRRYLGSAKNTIISRVGLTTAAYSVEFLSPDGMGWDLTDSTLIPVTNVTASTAPISFTVGGTYKAEPYITITLNTVTGATTKTIQLTNGTTQRSLSITRTWANGDFIEIDTLRGKLLVNGLATVYRGALPSFDVGAIDLVYSDDFTTRDVNVEATYRQRWL